MTTWHFCISPEAWYNGFVYTLRVATVASGSTFAALIVHNGRMYYRMYGKAETYGFWLLLVYTLNVVAFTALVLGDTIPRVPNSLVYVGYLVSFFLGYKMLHYGKRRVP